MFPDGLYPKFVIRHREIVFPVSSTYRNNLEALEQWRIIPRMLRDAPDHDLETTFFGVKLSSPVLLAPVGVQGILHEDGESCSKCRGSLIMSSVCTRSIEAVAKANGDGHRPRSADVRLSILSRANAAGFTALVFTVDSFTIGWRPNDLDTTYLSLAAGIGMHVGTSDPVFMKRMGAPGDEEAVPTMKICGGWLRLRPRAGLECGRTLRGPIVLKGVQTVEDAHAAMDARMDGIVVSNHGGRQVDGGISSFSALEKTTASPRGCDVINAIAMGAAQGVLVGRPFMYWLAVGGEQGVEVLRSLLADAKLTLGLSGYKCFEEIWAKRGEILS
ncbi:FMN-dependent dehydrogenase [Lactarius tabidus]